MSKKEEHIKAVQDYISSLPPGSHTVLTVMAFKMPKEAGGSDMTVNAVVFSGDNAATTIELTHATTAMIASLVVANAHYLMEVSGIKDLINSSPEELREEIRNDFLKATFEGVMEASRKQTLKAEMVEARVVADNENDELKRR